jgi:lipopolysaccharide transport system ATP-binding protein
MSSEIAVSAEALGKRYRLGRREKYRTLRDEIMATITGGFARRRAARNGGPEEWIDALREVSFDVRAGEVVGIMGRNGAGKSTLLKVLARITEPTSGRAEIRGRMSSLLEVGTGFHPELTGRENIFLNAAILGMRRAEIVRRFDEIVAFAEVERFIDTPVKHYSSGMYLRLAFAVAAHLEPDILVVDEVLAVGDASFQRKCLNKMQDVGRDGRTVLFVSHNMSAITRLCERTILLDAGQVIADGPSYEVVSSYLNSGIGTTAAREWLDLKTAPGNEIVRLRAVRVLDADGKIAEAVDISRPVRVEMDYEVLTGGAVLSPNLGFYNEEGVCVFISVDHDESWRRRPRPAGRYTSGVTIPPNFLAEGSLVITSAITTWNPVTVHVNERESVAFQVVDNIEGDTARGDYAGHLPGIVRPKLPWTTRTT